MVLAASVILAAAFGASAAFADVPRLPAAVSTSAEPACLRALTAIAAAEIPDPANFQRVACPSHKPVRAFRYDMTSHATRTTRPVAQSEIVPIFSEFSANMILPGQVLQLVTQSGAVRIIRQVQALQAARSGERLFVKASDGQIFSARYEAASP